jgi:hypothetical protein
MELKVFLDSFKSINITKLVSKHKINIIVTSMTEGQKQGRLMI